MTGVVSAVLSIQWQVTGPSTAVAARCSQRGSDDGYLRRIRVRLKPRSAKRGFFHFERKLHDMPKTLFLPGAVGSPEFWKPVANLLQGKRKKVLFGWPGLGDQPHDGGIKSIDDLVQLVDAEIDGPVDLVAQSMGGVIAARIALARPTEIRRLVLAVTSAGVNMAQFGASDWRADYRRQFPNAAGWITEDHAAAELAVERITAPTLLIWGDADPISPVAVGQHLERRMPKARLHVIPGGDHSLASTRADLVTPLIARHLSDSVGR